MMGMLRGDACCGGAASASRIYCSTCASIIARWASSKPTCFSEKNSVSVDCLLLLGLGVAVGWFGVVGATVVTVELAAGEACARRGWRLGPIRALRVCMASDVSLPLESVEDELSQWLLSSDSASLCFCWEALSNAVEVVVFDSSVR